MDDTITTIKVSKANKARLAAYGRLGETYDDALGKVLDEIEELRKKVRDSNPLMGRITEPIPA